MLEKKVRAKDLLFDEALSASTGCAKCSCAPESVTLTNKLKKRVIEQKTKLEEAENEIKRLLKTVKVVEVAVPNEDDVVLKTEISRLKRENDALQRELNDLKGITSASAQFESAAK